MYTKWSKRCFTILDLLGPLDLALYAVVICSRRKSVLFNVVLMVPDDALTLIYFRIKRLERKRYYNENL